MHSTGLFLICHRHFSLPFSMSSPHFFDQARKLLAYPFSISARSCISCCRSLQSLKNQRQEEKREINTQNYQHNRFIFYFAGNDTAIKLLFMQSLCSVITKLTCSYPRCVWWSVCSCQAPRRNHFRPAEADHRCGGTFPVMHRFQLIILHSNLRLRHTSPLISGELS